MRISTHALFAYTLFHSGHAYKGMAGMTAELLNSLTVGSDHVIEMIGDLETGPSTVTGEDIRDCLTGEAGCQRTVSRVSPTKKKSMQ